MTDRPTITPEHEAKLRAEMDRIAAMHGGDHVWLSDNGRLLTTLDASRAETAAAHGLVRAAHDRQLQALAILSPAGDASEGLVAAARRVVGERDEATRRAVVAEARLARAQMVLEALGAAVDR